MKFLFELAKIIAKKSASLGKRKKDKFWNSPSIRRRGDEIDEPTMLWKIGGERRKGKERRKPPESSGNGN